MKDDNYYQLMIQGCGNKIKCIRPQSATFIGNLYDPD